MDRRTIKRRSQVEDALQDVDTLVDPPDMDCEAADMRIYLSDMCGALAGLANSCGDKRLAALLMLAREQAGGRNCLH
jgi:hypothetical protein